MRRKVAFLCLLAILPTSCGGGGEAQPESTPSLRTPTADSPPAPTADRPRSPDLEAVRVDLVEVAPIEGAIAMAMREGDDGIYVATKGGLVVAVRDGEVSDPLVDLSGEVSTGSEQGLLGLAISPDGRYLYLDFTDGARETVVAEFAFDGNGVDRDSRRRILSVEQPGSNHNGGTLAFGPDGFLYISLGDGGGTSGNGQDLSTLLGSLLRIDPRPAGDRPYGVPDDNPFVDTEGARPEIWAYGLRNPWRVTFDGRTGDLWMADVGSSDREEVDFEPAGTGGRNYGWPNYEGTIRKGEELPDAVAPVYEYVTGERGRAIIGGYVYRGDAIPTLVGAYLFSDFYDSRITALVRRGERIVDERDISDGISNTMSFGQDLNGELYVLSADQGIFRLEPSG